LWYEEGEPRAELGFGIWEGQIEKIKFGGAKTKKIKNFRDKI
jgi:hypothetical protein